MKKVPASAPGINVDPEFKALIPPLQPEERELLKESIKAHGVRDPVVYWKETGALLDGHNRLKILLELSAEGATADGPELTSVSLPDRAAAKTWIIKNQIGRRNLNESQRAMCAARLSNLEPGDNQHSSNDLTSQDDAARLFNVSVPSIKRAKTVLESGRQDLIEQVDRGTIRASRAYNMLALAEYKDQVEALARLPTPDAPKGMYDVIVIDFPWPGQQYGQRDDRPQQAGVGYPKMTEEEVLAWDVAYEHAADDCHFFFWATHKALPLAFEVLKRRGLDYRWTFVWHKPGGFQCLGQPQLNCEFIVYATKGSPKFIDTKDFPVCFEAPRKGNSVKPEEFYETIRRVTAGRRIDFFNRRPIKEFDVWGKEAPAEEASA
jgi:N6-adenosine-specific RNA methylase IME4